MKNILLCTTILLLLIPAASLKSQNVEVTISGLRSEKGQIILGVFTSEEAFEKEESILEKRVPKNGSDRGSMTISLTLESGVYGISVLDDENNNGKMEFNFLGIPREGFGFSDYYHTGLTKPKFTLYRFSIGGDTTRKVSVRIRYILKNK